MSSTESSGSDSNSRIGRQPAKRAFADEFADATEVFRESEDERAPKFAVLPTGERANRVFAVGTLTEAEDIGSDSEYWQARVVDPTGTFYVYAGQYQPEAMIALRGIETPEYVAVVGKPRTYETDDGDVLVSLTPESITVVDEATRDQWVVEAAEQTLDRLDAMEGVKMGDEVSGDIRRALDVYGEEVGEYEDSVKEALAQIAGVALAEESEENDESEGEDE